MKKIKAENLIAIAALLGVLALFGGFAVTGNGVKSILFALVLVLVGIGGMVFFRCVPGTEKTPVRVIVGCVLCLVLMSALTLNTQAAFNFTDTAVETYLTVSATSSGSNNSTSSVGVSSGVVTITAKGFDEQGDCSDPVNNADTITITITNKGTAAVTYDLVVDGVAGITGGTGLTLEAGASITGTVTSRSGASSVAVTGTLTFSNVAPVSTGAAVDTTFANHSQGTAGTLWTNSVGGTYTVDGAAISSTTTHSNPSDHQYALVATPASGYEFYGWMSQNDGLLTTSATYTYTGVEGSSDTIWPLFAKVGEAMYYLKDASPRLYYHTLTEAITAAEDSGTIVVARDGILPAGDYTIPAGVTFLVPFDDAGTVYTQTPETLAPPPSGTSLPTPEPYRTLTMADGAKITVNGTMSVPAKVVAGNTEASKSSCRVYGKYGIVKMNSGSSITVNGTLSVFGYITGDGYGTLDGNGKITGRGYVEANSGATIYESFQIADFRGGQATVRMNSGKKVFPFSQYYIQNIEVPLKLHSGAKETAYTALYMSDTILPTSVTFISNSNAMFTLTSGYMVKQYDKASDRLVIDINGNMSVSSISIEIKYGIEYPVNSGNFPLPITGNMTVNINSGTTSASQDLALLPGSEINIDSGATFKVASGCEIFVYDLDEWKGKTFVYNNVDLKKLYWTPGQRYDRTAADLKDAQITVAGTLDASQGRIYTTAGGAAIVGKDGGKVILTAGSTENTNQATQSGTSVTNVSIPVNSAWLKNAKNTSGFAADNDYTQTAGASNVTYVYSEEHGRWAATAHTFTDTVTDPTCTEQGYTTHTCACSYSYTDTPVAATGNHTYGTDCLCTMCGRAGIRYNSYYLDLQGQIYLTFTFTVEPGVDITDVYVHVTEEANKIDAQDSWYMLLSSVSKDDKGRYVISQGIAAGAMTGNVTVQFQIGSDPNAAPLTFFDGNSETGTSVVKTVKDYLQTAITSAQSSDTLKALCQAAAQFGGYAQKFYQTHLDDVVSSILGDYSKMPTADDFKNFLTKTDGSIDGVAATGQQVNLDSAVFLRVYFNVADPSAITSIQAGLNMDGVTLDEVELKTDDSGRYYVDVENIPVACWNDEYIISINNGVYTVTTSVMAWARSCIYLSNDTDQRLMAAAMFTFAKAADEYFYS